MLLNVGELARRSALTVRTLHHYDATGLLTPSARADNGDRLYDRDDIARLASPLLLTGRCMNTLRLRLHGLSRQRTIAMLAALLTISTSINHSACAQTEDTTRVAYSGTVGEAKVGMTLALHGKDLGEGHYFYYRYLKDIALTGQQSGGTLTLQEANGAFTLHFVGNGSNGGQPLDFPNSVGLAGTWTGGGKTLPVKLALESMSSADTNAGRLYGMITDESDHAFEARAQGFYFAALKGDPKQAARFVHFPLRVNWGAAHHETIGSANQLAASWHRIFTPKYLAALRDAAPHDMPVIKSQYAMLGAGLAFFTDKGVEVLNAEQ
ncbi:MerR family DNA-binding transcriptional regulator [Paraburkholderia aromaticivorans]|uniref:MerR family DNA-binding transcriptional regulator n=1 Tax=Paraburkholderia aromaticivorans TaxID=2026199 RepID=UPI0038B9B4B4